MKPPIKITLAEGDMVDKYELGVHYLINLINSELEFGEYLVTDESLLSDFDIIMSYKEIEQRITDHFVSIPPEVIDIRKPIWQIVLEIKKFVPNFPNDNKVRLN